VAFEKDLELNWGKYKEGFKGLIRVA